MLLPFLWNQRYLKHFSLIQMKEPQFQWTKIMGEGGFGKALRERFTNSPHELGEIFLPWDQLNAQESLALFDLSNKSIATQMLLPFYKSPDKLRMILPKLTVQHLDCLHDDTLCHSQFPWDICVQFKGIGYWLSGYKQFAKIQGSIPWKTFVTDFRDEAKKVFAISSEQFTDQHRIGEKLKLLSSDTIKILLPIWNLYHLPCFPFAFLENVEFPWDDFLKQDGIGKTIRSRYANKPEFLAKATIPWSGLNQKEVDALFDLKQIGDTTKVLLRSLENKMDALRALMPKLQMNHLALLSDSGCAHQQFPWDECIKLKGVGYWLSQRQNFSALQSHISWITFARENPSEFQVLFAFRQGEYAQTLTIKARLKSMQKHSDFEALFTNQYLSQEHRNLLT